jgi:hypothetical protein
VVLIAPDGTLGSQFPFGCATEGVYAVSICRVPAGATTNNVAAGRQMHFGREATHFQLSEAVSHMPEMKNE